MACYKSLKVAGGQID